TLRAEVTLAGMRETEFTHSVEHWRTPALADPASDLVVRQPERQAQGSVDYSDPIAMDTRVEAGDGLEVRRQDTDSGADSLVTGRQVFVPDPARSYRFRLDQQVHALYATFQRPLGAFHALAGLRGEYAIVRPDLRTGGTLVTNRDAGLYPTLHLDY